MHPRHPVVAVLLVAFSLLAASCRSEPPPVADPTSRRATPAGELVGFTGAYGSHVWRGIPYARPPVGPLRWRAPQAAEPWPGVREALTSGSICPQLASSFGGDDSVESGTPVGSEDCLTLSAYAPAFAPDAVPTGAARLPVMVWLHGGGNVVGSSDNYDGGNLAASRDVVVVAINYRLGPFGWLRHASLRGADTSAEDRSGNFGTLDQIRALEWVRDNVSAFGGDPSRVTIFGESAGGRDVFALLVSPRARGLFHRAIVQSGGTESLPLHEAENLVDDAPPGEANSSGEVLLRLLVADDRAADRATAQAAVAAMSPGEVAGFLRERSSHEILAAYSHDDLEDLPDVPQLFRDGVVLPAEDGMELLARGGAYNAVPVMLGTNRDEHRLFFIGKPEYVRWVLWLAPRLRDPERFLATTGHMSDWWKVGGADAPAAALRHRQGPSVWVYRFDWDEEPTLFFSDLSTLLGASHAFEIPFVFGHWDLGRRARVLFSEGNAAGREELSRKMMSWWAQFAATGDPGRGRDGDLTPWKPWDDSKPDAERFLVIDTEAGGGVRMSSESLSEAGVLAAIEADPRLPGPRERCDVYRELADWGRGFGPEDYTTAGGGECSDFPLDAGQPGG